MGSNQEDGTANVGAFVPTNHAEALFQLAQHLSTRSDRTTQSDLIRRYVAEGLRRDVESMDLPGEIADLLDEDLLANAGEGLEQTDLVDDGEADDE